MNLDTEFIQLLIIMLLNRFRQNVVNTKSISILQFCASILMFINSFYLYIKIESNLDTMDISVWFASQCAYSIGNLLQYLRSTHPALRDISLKILCLTIVARSSSINHKQIMTYCHLI